MAALIRSKESWFGRHKNASSKSKCDRLHPRQVLPPCDKLKLMEPQSKKKKILRNVSRSKKRSSQAAADQDVEKVKKRLVGSSCETVSSHLIVSPSARRKIIFLTFFLIFSLSLNLLSCLFQFRFSSSRLFSRAILFASQLSLSSFLFLPSLSFCYLLAYSVSVLTKPLYSLRLLFHLSYSLPLCLSHPLVSILCLLLLSHPTFGEKQQK